MDKRKIAVLGGGIGAITAAYAITQLPNWQDDYEITVYQMGWRLGGKAASGRSLAKNGRIEEQGLHLWAGSYDNTFRLMRDCYDQLAALGLRSPDDPLGTLEKAFKPLHHVFINESMAEPDDSTQSEPWRMDFPPNTQAPGSNDEALSPADYFQLLQVFARELAEALEAEGSAAADPVTLRRLRPALDLAAAAAKGMVADQVLTQGFDPLDQWEFSEWLTRHGASVESLSSPVLQSCCDHISGGQAARNIGAGTALRHLLRLGFGYRGALFFKAQAGMGDAVFAPYYQVLEARGVQFKFFHAVTALHLTPDDTAIGSIDLVVQAEPTSGLYEPLVPVQNLPCWPSEPLWQQLTDGETLHQAAIDFEDESEPPTGKPLTLTRGQDFDDIILGISLGALPRLTPALAEASPEWAAMLAGVESVATQTAQLWLTVPSSNYGWKQLVDRHNPDAQSGSVPLHTMATALPQPLTAWADRSELLGRADWGDDRPFSIAYFRSPRDERDAGQPLAVFKRQVQDWMNRHLTALWPDMASSDGSFNLKTLHGPPQADGQARVDWQYFRVNEHGSARSVLAVSSSVGSRLRSDQSGFSNLLLAGDWTLNGLNIECVEAATVSGLQAARGLTGAAIVVTS